jgi:hypothetical protein
MKKFILITVFLLFYHSGFTQYIVNDENKINQLKSIEYMQWKLTPKWYYYSWYTEDVLGVPILLPGLGIHDKGILGVGGGSIISDFKEYYDQMGMTPESAGSMLGIGVGEGDNYVNKYNNNIKQYTPAIAAVMYNKAQAEEQENDTKTVYNQEFAKNADKEVDYAYTLSASRRNELKTEFLYHYHKYASDNSIFSDGAKNCKTLLFEYERILSNVKIINESHMSNAKKREAYVESEQELVELVALANRLANLNNVLKLSSNE